MDGPGKEIVRLCTPKDKKTPPAADDETPKDAEKTDASSTTVEAKTAQSPAALKTTSAKKPKANPLAKFLVKMKPGTGQGKLQPKENIFSSSCNWFFWKKYLYYIFILLKILIVVFF